ncbi:MAG: hypothetical protein Q7S34_03860 [bacterium]|nr:hypothetical protein [bacterium]
MSVSLKTNADGVKSGRQVKRVRIALGINQSNFWKIFGITQSGGCRYENGRKMPIPLRKLLMLILDQGTIFYFCLKLELKRASKNWLKNQ